MLNARAKVMKTPKCLLHQASLEDSDRQLSQSGALIGSNDDILTEILLRLPATSIIRFKSVSKHWRRLLSHRHFILRYDSLSKSPGLFARETYVPFDVENVNRSSPPFRSLDFFFNSRGISIVQSCNGLLLCCDDACGPFPKYYVFNPTTKQLELIPWIRGGRKAQDTILFMSLAFHQTDCVHYKLVCIRRLVLDDDVFQIQKYSSRRRRWKISMKFFSNHPDFVNGVYWNGAIYWQPTCRSHLYFKLKTEQLLTLPLPEEMMSDMTWATATYIGESRGHLHLIVTDHKFNTSRLNVYEMLMDHSRWFVKYQLDLDQLYAFPEMNASLCYQFYYVVDVVRGEKEEDAFVVFVVPDKMIIYNVHNKSFKHISSLTFSGILSFHRYTELLASF